MNRTSYSEIAREIALEGKRLRDLSEPHPDVDRVILDRAEYERLRSINAELLKALEYIFASGQPLLTAAAIRQAKAAIERAKA